MESADRNAARSASRLKHPEGVVADYGARRTAGGPSTSLPRWPGTHCCAGRWIALQTTAWTAHGIAFALPIVQCWTVWRCGACRAASSRRRRRVSAAIYNAEISNAPAHHAARDRRVAPLHAHAARPCDLVRRSEPRTSCRRSRLRPHVSRPGSSATASKRSTSKRGNWWPRGGGNLRFRSSLPLRSSTAACWAISCATWSPATFADS